MLVVYDLHVHSKYSDGNASIEEIARRAKRLGLKAVGIVDHSIELPFGLTEAKAKRRQEEIDDAMSTYGIKIYSGIECSIDAAGDIVLPDFDFDFIVASVHEYVDGEEYYRRVMNCLEKHEVNVVGHLFSPLFGFEMNIMHLNEKLVEVVEEREVAVEINSSHRCPPDEFLALCRDRNLVYSIGSDAHVLPKVGDISWSIEKAKRYMKRAKPFNP